MTKPSSCPHCHKNDGNLVTQPCGRWMCIDCYWEDPDDMDPAHEQDRPNATATKEGTS